MTRLGGKFQYTGQELGFSQSVNKDIQKILKVLKTLPKELEKKERKKILKKAAEPLVRAAKSFAPESSTIHYRYENGRQVQAFYPGNLKNSIQVLKLRKSSDVFVGPKISKRNRVGDFGAGNKVDAYYAHWVEFGSLNNQPVGYMRKAFDLTKGQVKKEITKGVTATVKKWIAKNRVP